MSSSGSPRRDQRRRLLISWTRSASTPTGGAGPGPRTMADYAPAALPERQPAVATLVPTRLGRFIAAAVAILLTLAAAISLGFHDPTFTSLGRMIGPRFARTVAALRSCFDPRLALSLAGWLSQVLLLGGAAVALVVRGMRRHRRDDYGGRYRAWGWMACLLAGASCAAQVPVGAFVAALVTEATGVTFGPAGYGWWVAIAATLFGGVSLWTVLPLHERLTTALWLGAGLAAWTASAAATWAGAAPGIAAAAWAAGSGFVAIAMLAGARSVIREVRGESAGGTRQSKPKQPITAHLPAVGREIEVEEDPLGTADWTPGGATSTDYTDGSDDDEERETRHLSKAERKRLRKQARLNRAA